MKILHIIPSLAKGGAERLVLDVCMTLHKCEGITVKLITFRGENAYAFMSREVDHEVIPSKVVPSMLGQWTREIAALQKAVDTFQPDVLHTHLFEAEMVVSQLKLTHIRRIVHFHDNMPQMKRLGLSTFFSKKAITSYFERQVTLRSLKAYSAKAIAISKDTELFVRRNLGDRMSVRLLLNAIQIERFFAAPELPRTPQTVTIGSLVPKKNQQFALQVMYSLKSKGIELHLDILGDGPDRNAIEKRIKELDLEETVTLNGNVDHPEDFLKSASFYLHTATYEPFGLVLLEAMAAGVPVISLEGGGNKDIIQHENNGFLLTEQDPEQFADLLISLMNNEKRRFQVAKTGQEFAMSFGIEAYVDRLLEVYRG